MHMPLTLPSIVRANSVANAVSKPVPIIGLYNVQA